MKFLIDKENYLRLLEHRDKGEDAVIYTRNTIDIIGELILWKFLSPTSPISNKGQIIEIGRVFINPDSSTRVEIYFSILPKNKRSSHEFHAKIKFSTNLLIKNTNVLPQLAKEVCRSFNLSISERLDPEEIVINLVTSLDLDDMKYIVDYDYVLNEHRLRTDLVNHYGRPLLGASFDDLKVMED